MKAIVQDRYGPPEVFELKDIDQPVVEDDEVLVRVHAAAVNAADCFVMRGLWSMRMIYGLFKPRNGVRGSDVAGTVEAVGRNVTRFQPGDEVFGWCKAAFAEYVSADESHFVPKPAGITFEQAAAVPMAGTVALQALRDKGKVQPGQRVLINGASGGIGTFAVQIAKVFETEVTGVCSTRNVDMVQSIGADHVIDYTKENFTKSGQRYDFILDIVGNHALSDCRRALTPRGILIPNTGRNGLGYVIKANLMSLFVPQTTRGFVSVTKNEDLLALKELLEAGKVAPVIDRTYPLDETPEALGYVEAGHTQGKVVITV